jgi:hypothetical protein
MYNHHKPTKILQTAADSLKVSRDRPKAPSVNSDEYQGLAGFDPAAHSSRHKHGSHKQRLQSLDKPVVEVHTEKVSEYNAAPVVSGIALSPEQLINYHNGDFR